LSQKIKNLINKRFTTSMSANDISKIKINYYIKQENNIRLLHTVAKRRGTNLDTLLNHYYKPSSTNV